jgi:DNA-binding response OmpR family regulator
MFKKVLIAEDLDSISIAVVQALESLSIEVIQHSKYCDDALQVKKSTKDNDPYDLLISDLSFKRSSSRLTCGDELIEAVKNSAPY